MNNILIFGTGAVSEILVKEYLVSWPYW